MSKSTKKSSTSTPHGSQPASAEQERRATPLSPTRITRFQEKEELKDLNDRLAIYIDRVRQLESENDTLLLKVQTNEETVTREVTSIKSLYDNELSHARRILDEVAKEKAKVQIDCTKYKQEYEETLAKLNKKEKEVTLLEKNGAYHESKIMELQGKLGDKKKVEDENKELKKELDGLSKQLASVRSQLDQEILLRVDGDNRNLSLKEELDFKKQVYEKETMELRTKKQVEISEIDGMQERYEQQLAETLLELRDQYENQMRLNREEMDVLYNVKMDENKKLNDQYSHTISALREELLETKSKFSNFNTKLNEKDALIASLQQRLRDLERSLEDERNGNYALLKAKDEEVAKLRDDIANQLKDYQDLMCIRVALDMEIAAYRSLLEGEEARLHLTPGSGRERSSRSTPLRGVPVGVRGAKRKRTSMGRLEESSSSNIVSNATASGDVEVAEHDTDGKFVKLRNKGENDINVGGWQLIRKAGDEQVSHKFHRSVVIKAGTVITVWSSDSEVVHAPPLDIVMKSQKWPCGSNVTTRLLNNSGEEVACRETYRQILSSSHSSSGLESHRHGGEVRYEELYHQQIDQPNQEKCRIM